MNFSDNLDQIERLKEEAKAEVFKRDRAEIIKYVQSWFNGEIDELELHSKINAYVNAETFNRKAALKKTVGIHEEYQYGIGAF